MNDANRGVGVLAIACLATGALLAAGFARRTPTFQAPDEQAHYSYAQAILLGGPPAIDEGDWDARALQDFIREVQREGWGGCSWPDTGDPAMPPCFPQLSYEDHQPPLYYVLVALQGFYGHSGIVPIWLDSAFPSLAHETVPLIGQRRTSLMLSLLTLAVCLMTVRMAFPRRSNVAVGATAFIAFLPMYAYMSAVVNNDALANLVMAVALLAAVRRLAGLTKRRRYVVWVGLIWGAALLTKLTVYPVILPLVVAEVLRTRREGAPVRDAVEPAAKGVGLGLLIGAPWFIRNMYVYGLTDPFGMAAHDRVVVGQPRTVDWIAEHGWGRYLEQAVEWTFESFWGKFGWMEAPMDRRIYAVLAVASVVMAVGFAGYVRRAWRAEGMGRDRARDQKDQKDQRDLRLGTGDDLDVGPLQRDVLMVFGLVVLTTVGGYVWYNLTFVQHQGRYLFPALIPLATAAMLGIREWARWAARAAGRPEWAEGIAAAGMVAFDGGLLATSVWALVHVIPTLWPGR